MQHPLPFSDFKSRHFLVLAIVGLFSFAISASVWSQDEDTLPDSPEIAIFQQAKANIEKLAGELDEMQRKARTLPIEDKEGREKLQTSFAETVKSYRDALVKLRSSALAALKVAPKSKLIGETLVRIAAGDASSDDYVAARQILDQLIAGGNPAQGIYDVAAQTAFAQEDFTKAKQYLEKSIELQEPRRLSSQRTVESLEKNIVDWKKELEIRAAEAAADDLPRVKLSTTAGDIVIELFENQAPQAVGNFVNLVEKKYYDGLKFHRVLSGFMAQGGCPKGTGTGGPGYKIYCECHQDNYRKHFAGTLSMAHAGRDTGGSQFFLTFLPTPFLDGRHTAFGRVIEGMDVLKEIERIDPRRPSGAKPTVIETATVIRKRDHEYVPTKVK